MHFVLDLGEIMSVSTINMGFLNPQAQPDWHLMALQKHVSYTISIDGEHYDDPIESVNPHKPNPFENPDISKTSIHSFQVKKTDDRKVRYIKAHAENLLQMPS